MQCAGPVEILPELHGCRQLPGQLSVACEIVINNWFLEPVEALPVERVTAVQCIAETEALIEIYHQLDIRAGRAAHRLYRREVVSQSVAAQAQLERLETAFGDKRSSVVAQTGYLGKPQAIAVVGRHRTGRAAQQDGERSEEHTSELQSRSDLVCRLLLEKKKHGRTRPPSATPRSALPRRRRAHRRARPRARSPEQPPSCDRAARARRLLQTDARQRRSVH